MHQKIHTNPFWSRILEILKQECGLPEDGAIAVFDYIPGVDAVELERIQAGDKAISVALAVLINKTFPQAGVGWLLGGGPERTDEREETIVGYWLLEKHYCQCRVSGHWIPDTKITHFDPVLWIFRQNGRMKLLRKAFGGLKYNEFAYDRESGILLWGDNRFFVAQLSGKYLFAIDYPWCETDNVNMLVFQRVNI